jgi:formate hydrogenlyase transcriptional activator
MRTSRLQRSHSINIAIAQRSGQVEELQRFARRLDAHSDLEQLLRSLPAELGTLVTANTTALIYINEGNFCLYGVDGERSAIGGQSAMTQWRDEVDRLISEQPQPFVISSLDQEIRFPQVVQFFREHGNESLCVRPLNTAQRRLGVLCFARKSRAAFSPKEVGLLALIGEYVALAINDRFNLAYSEAVRAQLENERTKLRVILDLNNSVVSNLELREILRSVSPIIRNTLQLDGVALILPDAAKGMLQLYALDFPVGNGTLYQGMSRPLDGSLASQVYRSGKPWVGNIEDLNGGSFDSTVISGTGVETICMLPLVRYNSTLGVLCLVRLQKDTFTSSEVEFLSHIAGQVAIAIDNAFGPRPISELADRLTQERLYLEDEICSEMNFEEIIGNSVVLRKVLNEVEVVAPTNSTVLIQGETGSGKELIARAVHNLSRQRSHPFVKLNCAAIPTGLLESELFGHEKGAFTGAIAQRMGRFELASEGTIFLDEISEIPLDLQPKLLRVLQEREFERLGSSRTIRTDARLIAATNRDLKAMVEEQRFRSDLFYRLNVFPIHVPPLRERKEDIPVLVRHFAQHFARKMAKNIDTIPAETMSALVRYPWPGNIRELQNVIERAVILSKGPVLKVSLADLEPKGLGTNGHTNGSYTNGAATLEEIERKHILSVLEQTNWVLAGPYGAAAKLGMKRPTLQFRMQKLGITRPQKPLAGMARN